jgi:1-phosphatidylinositol-4-phosphate 5-kinase
MFSANFQTLAELCSSGKSGSFFYYTQDGRFVLKTIPRHEFKFMKKILPNYHDFLTQTNPESFISRVYGIHKVIFYRKGGKLSKKIYFCIMNNVFHTSLKIDLRYDLKGSTYGRNTITDKGGVMVDRTIALKDCDFLDKHDSIKVGKESRERILDITKKDSDFFRDNNIIDYSMLIGVTNRSEHP